MKAGTKNQQKSMPGALLRKTHEKMSLLHEMGPKWTDLQFTKNQRFFSGASTWAQRASHQPAIQPAGSQQVDTASQQSIYKLLPAS